MLIPPGPSSESLPRKKATEEDLSLLWYRGVFARPGLRTRCGRRVRVLYRGLPNGERGPDYIGAVLSLGRGKPKAGDIELHLRTSQWRAHGHHKDAHYEGVILHVVWQDDDPRPTPLPGGRQVPVLALEGLSAVPGEIGFVGEPCRAAATWGSEWLGGVLDKAGEDRFLAKAARLEGDMAALPAQEVLYQALAETLGYSQNRRPCRLLAGSLPLGTLEGFLWGKATDRREAIAQALLLGSAGLLPCQRGLETGQEWEGLLEQLWKASGLEPQLGLGDWSLGVRPENHPARRLAGLASLVVESLGDGLIPWALASLKLRDREQGMWRRLKQEASGYWTGHFDFGRAGKRLSRSLIGQDRAIEMVVNALLPFAYAYGQIVGDDGLSQDALGAYALLPSPGSNQVTRHMARQLLGADNSSLAKSARRQQGLLHLFHSYCTRGRCGACPLSSP